MTSRAVHPVADLFPMLAADELAELADDIKIRGLLQPIVLDAEGRVLDGRNRLAACKIAGAEPWFETYDGDDPDGYALAVNIARRHLTKGQQAMIAARWRLVSKQSQRVIAEATGLNAGRIGQAAVVLDHAPDLADLVVSGAQALDTAYEEARKRKKDADSDERKMLRLQHDAPDLAAKVVEGEQPLNEAIGALDARQRKQADDQRDARALLTRIVDLAVPSSMSNGFVETWAAQLGDADSDLLALVDRAEQAAQVLLDLTKRVNA